MTRVAAVGVRLSSLWNYRPFSIYGSGMGSSTTSRISSLLKALEQKPTDAFLRYALGVEYAQEGQLDRAKGFFVEVRAQHPEYVPTYLQLGVLLESQGEVEEARTTYEQGLIAARAAKDFHAASELQSALDVLS